MRLGPIVALLSGVALVAGCGTEADHAVEREADRIAASDHWAIVEVSASHDYLDGPTLFVELSPEATDQDARDVWCDIVVQTTEDRAWRTEVFATRKRTTVGWTKPRNCADPESIPEARRW